MNDFKERKCGECYFWKKGKCRVKPPIMIDGRFTYPKVSSKNGACGLFVPENKKNYLLENE